MIPTAAFITCAISLAVSLVLPVLALLIFTVKNRKQGILSAWLLGAAGFVVTQLLIRVPILNALAAQDWFIRFSQSHLFLYAFSLAFTAGLFELAGRFAVAKLMQKNLTYNRSLAAGLGHGGIEAMVLVGITYINNLAYMAMINAGTFDAAVAQTAAMGVDVGQLELLKVQLLTTSPALYLLGGFERLLAMTAHAAMSMLVCYGVAQKKVLPCTLVCLGIHTFIDLTAGLTLILPQTTAYLVIYSILTAVAVVSVLVIRRISRSWKEVSHEK
ncbi:MAG: YhfC family intramembrane metalloprotease [Oscillospiraceae bacterium]|nr:YhfC family intramembrane metalloprotease [Oscillospiraceae bacterium]